MRKRLLVASLLTLASGTALAQRVTAPVEIISFSFVGDEGLLDSWGGRFLSLGTNSSESARLRDDIVDTLCPGGKACQLDFQRPHFVVFPIPGKASGDQPRTLVRLVIWERDDPVYLTNLRGVDQAIEIFISPNSSDVLNSLYTSTAVEDPRGAELAAALKQLGPTLFAQLGPGPGLALIKGPPVPKRTYYASVRRVVLPYKRAKIGVKNQLLSEVKSGSTTSQKVTAAAEASYDNAAPNHIGFSLIGAGIIRVAGARRTKIDNGNIVENSFDGAASILALNVHPWSYDPTELPISAGERWRLFLGIVATPELGIAVGGGWAPFRNLSVNAGYAWLRVKTTKGGEAIGGSPPDGDTSPLRHGASRAFVFGVGYKFS